MKRKKSNLNKSEIYELILDIMDLGFIKHKNSEKFFLISTIQGGKIHSRVASIETIYVLKKKNVFAQIKKIGDVSIRNCKKIIRQQGFQENLELILFWWQRIFIFKDFNKKHKLINNYSFSI